MQKQPPTAKIKSSAASIALALLLSAIAWLACLAPAASADLILCGPGSGADQCEEPSGVAVDRTAGLLYVADSGNRRIDVFDADDGSFIRAFGWDVIPTGGPGDTGTGLEVCTTASTCQAGSIGGGAGQFGFALRDIAVDNDPASPAYHDLYVYDGYQQPPVTNSNNRVQRFHPNGEFVLMFGGQVNKTKVEEGAPAAQQNLCTAASGDVCQAGVGGNDPGYFSWDANLALGPGGVVHVGDHHSISAAPQRLQKFAPSGSLIEAINPLEGGDSQTFDLAVDSSVNFYVYSGSGALRKYDSSGALLTTSFFQNTQALAFDATDGLFLANTTGEFGNDTAIYSYDPAGTLLAVHYGNGTLKRRPVSLAPYESANGDIFAAEPLDPPGFGPGLGRVLQIAVEPPGPVVHPDPQHTNAKPIGNTTATLNTKINPEGKATTYHFEYVDDASYQAGGAGFASPKTKTTIEEALVPGTTPAFAPDLFRLSAASAPIGCADPTEESIEEGKCLVPSTGYHIRAVATNADGQDIGPESTFETAPPFEILATWSSEVGLDAAKLSAEVNPLKIPAKGRFEYIEEQTCLEDVKGAEEEGKAPEEVAEACFAHAQSSVEVDFGAGDAPLARTVQLNSLSVETTYRYRIFVEDFFTSQLGEERSFATFPLPEAPNTDCPNQAFRIGPSSPLPDCRAYEMVSPVDKEGGDIEVKETEENISQAEILQSASVVPVAGRGLTYSSVRSFGDALSAPYSSQYIASRHPLGDPKEGWSTHGISPPREGGSFGDDLIRDVQYKGFSDDLGRAWLRSDSDPPLEPHAIADFPNLYRRDNITDTYEAICPVKPKGVSPAQYGPKVQGASTDGNLVVFRANAKLTANASGALGGSPPLPIFQLYACAGGQLRLVSVLPPAQGGKATTGNSSAGTAAAPNHRHDSLHNAVSTDGERIYWTDSVEGSVGKIYLRERPLVEGAECANPTSPCTIAVSEAVGVSGADKKAQFWTASADGAVAIFSFTDGPLEDNLYEFRADSKTTDLIAAGVSGPAGWSEDASRLYFVSTEELVPGAVAGKPNLYLYEVGSGVDLVAALPGGTASTPYCHVVDLDPFRRCTRTTPDGGRLVFMAQDPLTGYDNNDAQSGKPDSEVFLYKASADGGKGTLICISCNPSGARPIGQGVKVVFNALLFPIAGRIPAWEHSLYAPRILSVNGRRLFFESFDSLVPTDTNGAQDVYEWEEAGEGDCEADDVNYFESNGGCLNLISSGHNPHDSQFVDASADGSDVFFKTAASLLPQDPGLIDLYDARSGGGFPIPPDAVPPCEGEACQSPPAPPQPRSPASASFRGEGDPKGKKGAKPSCPRKGKRVAKKAAKKARRCPSTKHGRKGHRRGRARR